eukprot:2224_1
MLSLFIMIATICIHNLHSQRLPTNGSMARRLVGRLPTLVSGDSIYTHDFMLRFSEHNVGALAVVDVDLEAFFYTPNLIYPTVRPEEGFVRAQFYAERIEDDPGVYVLWNAKEWKTTGRLTRFTKRFTSKKQSVDSGNYLKHPKQV